MKVLIGLLGAALVIAGVAAIYWQGALILAGLFFIRAYLNLEKTESNARKPQ